MVLFYYTEYTRNKIRHDLLNKNLEQKCNCSSLCMSKTKTIVNKGRVEGKNLTLKAFVGFVPQVSKHAYFKYSSQRSTLQLFYHFHQQ